MDMISISKVFISVILSLNHLWNLLKLGQNPYWKILLFNWYGEITLKILKEKLIKSTRIKIHLDVSIMYPQGIKFLRNKKKSFQKDYWKQGPILTFQKFLTNIWLRFHKIRFHVWLYDLVLQPVLSHSKQFEVEFYMNSWIF
jgi:hypothetical protein